MQQFTVYTSVITVTASNEENARDTARRLSKKYGRARVYAAGEKIAYYNNGVKIR